MYINFKLYSENSKIIESYRYVVKHEKTLNH